MADQLWLMSRIREEEDSSTQELLRTSFAESQTYRSQVLLFLGVKSPQTELSFPWNFRSSGTFIPMEVSSHGTFAPMKLLDSSYICRRSELLSFSNTGASVNVEVQCRTI